MIRVPQKNLFERGVKGVPPSVRIYSPRLEEPNLKPNAGPPGAAGRPGRTQMHFMLDLFILCCGLTGSGGCDVNTSPIGG